MIYMTDSVLYFSSFVIVNHTGLPKLSGRAFQLVIWTVMGLVPVMFTFVLYYLYILIYLQICQHSKMSLAKVNISYDLASASKFREILMALGQIITYVAPDRS